MCSTACVLSDGTIVRSYRDRNPDPSRFSGFIEALDRLTGRSLWRRSIPALVTSLVSVQRWPWLIYALTDGRVGVLHQCTGDQLHEQTLQLDRADTMVMSLATKDDRVACGTVDGRVLILRLRANHG
jgi:hypothetical protein